MYKFKNIMYYSMDELAKAINNPECKEEEELAAKWNLRYKRSSDVFTTSSYVYSKLHAAMKLKQIRYICFKKGECIKEYVAFSIKDVLIFLENYDYKVTKGFREIHDVKVIEVVNE